MVIEALFSYLGQSEISFPGSFRDCSRSIPPRAISLIGRQGTRYRKGALGVTPSRMVISGGDRRLRGFFCQLSDARGFAELRRFSRI